MNIGQLDSKHIRRYNLYSIIPMHPKMISTNSQFTSSFLGNKLFEIPHEMTELVTVDTNYQMQMGRHQYITEQDGVVFRQANTKGFGKLFIHAGYIAEPLPVIERGGYEETSAALLVRIAQAHERNIPAGHTPVNLAIARRKTCRNGEMSLRELGGAVMLR